MSEAKLEAVKLEKNKDGVLINKKKAKVKLKVKKKVTKVAVEKKEEPKRVPSRIEPLKQDLPKKIETESKQEETPKKVESAAKPDDKKGKIIISKKKKKTSSKSGFKYGTKEEKKGNYWFKKDETKSDNKTENQSKDEFAGVPTKIEIPSVISIKKLANKLNLKATQVVKKLVSLGVMDLTVNENIDAESAEVLCSELGCTVKVVSLFEETKIEEELGEEKDYVTRPPILTVMGHVDHGKTTLLDTIRKSSVAASESGGITQHMAAYMVKTKKSKFLMIDTPGHEAFSHMRSRGANLTDIIILVVSGVDGVKPQTIECIKHAKKSNIPLIVAVNKMDLQGFDLEMVKNMLSEHEVVSEDWGGDTIFQPISALNNKGIDELLEKVIVKSDSMNLKANPKIKATAQVLESRIEVGKGNVSTIIIKNGTLKVGDSYICGEHVGKLRGIFDEQGKKLKEASPSMVVSAISLPGIFLSGNLLQVVANEKEAKKIADKRVTLLKENKASNVKKITLSNLIDTIQQNQVKEKILILKGDSFGTVEAIRESLLRLQNEEVKINVIHAQAGSITENDINLAATSKADIIGFKVKPTGKLLKLIKEKSVKVKSYSIIYDIIDDLTKELKGMLNDERQETVQGKVEVKEIFKISGVGKIAGSIVIEGKIFKDSEIRIIRDGTIIYTSKVESLRRYKDEVKEVAEGSECGVQIKNYQDVKVGDILECFSVKMIEKELVLNTDE